MTWKSSASGRLTLCVLLFAAFFIHAGMNSAVAQNFLIPPNSLSYPSSPQNIPYPRYAESDEDAVAKPNESDQKTKDVAEDSEWKVKDAEKMKSQDEAKTRKQQERSQLISRGQTAFQNHCVQCHDADKSLEKSKSPGSWKATVARMARQDGADIPQSDWDPIAIYLASLNSSAGSGESSGSSDAGSDDSGSDTIQDAMDSAVSEVTVFGTISPTMRTHGTEIQNPGFFGDVWAGVAYEPNSGPLSAKMVACMSCHNEHDEGYLSRIEIVQASLTLNLGQVLRGETGKNGKNRKSNSKGSCTGCGEDSCLPASQFGSVAAERQVEAFVEAGRMVVPFGAFSSQVNPGVYRTVSRPLMFNMGQRVYDENLGDPVLPMPFSDEGADLNIIVPLFDTVSLGLDAYVVNGLQGSNNINFDDSRDYVDNNKTPAVGGRVTLGNSTLKLGSSIISGQYNANAGTGPDARGLNFMIVGADVSYRYKDILRVQAEFAQRGTQAFYDLADPIYARDKVSGYYVESELLLSRAARLSALCRWDEQRQRYGAFDPAGSLPAAAFDVNRLTYGLNWSMPGGSLLMFNMEHWYLPNGFNDMNVVGMRWAASF